MFSSWRKTAPDTAPVHRWMLVVPLVLLMVFLTVREGRMRLGADVVADGAWSAGSVHPDAGARYVVADDGALELGAGGIAVTLPGIGIVRAAGWDVSVWGGSAYVSVQGDRLTVAALDVPVIVRGTRGIAVVPAIRQWSAPKDALADPATNPSGWLADTVTKPLPASFVAEYLPKQGTLSVIDSVRTSDVTDGMAVAMHALSARPTRELAAAFRMHADLRLYALVHPSTRDVAWAFLPDDAPIDAETWVALLSLPSMTSADTAASSLTARRWGETLRTAFDASADPSAIRSDALPVLEHAITRVAADGFPLRALLFAGALRVAIGEAGDVDAAAAASYRRLESMTPESLRVTALADIARRVDVPVPAAVAAPDAVSDPALEQRAREVLVARGGMFTGDSSVTTVAPGSVDVRDVVFGFASGDRPLRFRYMVDSDTVRATVDGHIQPYAVPFDAYMQWESGR